MSAMTNAFRYLAWIIAAEVLVQAAAIAYAVFGEGKYIDEGHAVTKKMVEQHTADFSGVGGFALHGINGMMVLPLLGIALLVVGWRSDFPGALRDGGIMLGMIVVQIALAEAAGAVPILGAIHGALALAIFAFGAMLGVRVTMADKRGRATTTA